MGTCHSNESNETGMQRAQKAANLQLQAKRSLSVPPRKSVSGGTARNRYSERTIRNCELIHKVYRICSDSIGKGSFGEVRKAVHLKTGQPRAIKIIKLGADSKNKKKSLISEIEMLRAIDHPNIVRIHEYFENPSCFFIVMDLIEGEPLVEYIVKNLTELSQERISQIMFQLLQVLNYLHSRGIADRDIKSENLIYDGKKLTLVDFGISHSLETGGRCKRVGGSLLYSSPELGSAKITEKVDIWAAGVVMYVLMTGSFPFSGTHDEEIISKVKNSSYQIPINQIPNISDSAKDLLSKLLDKNPKTRISASDALQHSFIQESKPEVDYRAISEMISNLENFAFKNNLEEAIYSYFGDMFFSEYEDADLTRVFSEIDSDNSGCISREEFGNALVRSGKLLTEKEADAMFDKIDTDKNGSISFKEFKLAAFDRKKAISKKNVLAIFNLIDKVSFIRMATARYHP
jgi:calcium-dependent protein kinase